MDNKYILIFTTFNKIRDVSTKKDKTNITIAERVHLYKHPALLNKSNKCFIK